MAVTVIPRRPHLCLSHLCMYGCIVNIYAKLVNMEAEAQIGIRSLKDINFYHVFGEMSQLNM